MEYIKPKIIDIILIEDIIMTSNRIDINYDIYNNNPDNLDDLDWI